MMSSNSSSALYRWLAITVPVQVTTEGKDMFNSIEEAMQFMSHFSSTLDLSAKDKMIIAKDLYLNAENEKEAVGIVKKWTD